MSNSQDKISTKVVHVIKNSNEPLETIEIQHQLKSVSRTKLMYRLFHLRGDGLIHGKQIGSGKGAWVWWA